MWMDSGSIFQKASVKKILLETQKNGANMMQPEFIPGNHMRILYGKSIRKPWLSWNIFAENSEETELVSYGMLVWGNSNYNYSRAGMGWNYLGKSDFSWGSYKTRGFSDPHLVTYMESHDEERQLKEILTWGIIPIQTTSSVKTYPCLL